MALWLIGYVVIALVATLFLGRFFAASDIDAGTAAEHTASSDLRRGFHPAAPGSAPTIAPRSKPRARQVA